MVDVFDASRSWPGMIDALSHELRHEVSAVLHQLELLRSGTLDDASSDRSFAAMTANVESLVRFTDDLADLGRMERGEFPMSCRNLDVDALIDTCIGERAVGAQWLANGGDDAHTTVYADPRVVQHVVTSVLDDFWLVDRRASRPTVHVERDDEEAVEVSFLADGDSPWPSHRRVGIDDGLALFVAERSASLMGASLGVSGDGRARGFQLRLPMSHPTPHPPMSD